MQCVTCILKLLLIVFNISILVSLSSRDFCAMFLFYLCASVFHRPMCSVVWSLWNLREAVPKRRMLSNWQCAFQGDNCDPGPFDILSVSG